MADSTKSEQQETRSQTKKEKLNNFISSKIKEFTLCNFKDDNLWGVYKDEFDELTKKDFNLGLTSTLRCLRTFLRSRGVWVQWDRKTSLATSLYNTLLETDPTPWTKEEVERSNFWDISNLEQGYEKYDYVICVEEKY